MPDMHLHDSNKSVDLQHEGCHALVPTHRGEVVDRTLQPSLALLFFEEFGLLIFKASARESDGGSSEANLILSM